MKKKKDQNQIPLFASLPTLVDARITTQANLQSLTIRQTHLAKRGRICPDTNAIIELLQPVNEYLCRRIAAAISDHPAHDWFSRVKGVGEDNIAKVIGLARVAPEIGPEGNELPYANSISALWKYAGYAPKDGKAMKRVKGQKLEYNAMLRIMSWRLASSLSRAGLRQQCDDCGEKFGSTDSKTKKKREACPECGSVNFHTVATTKFGDYFLRQKAAYTMRLSNQGIKIVPAASLPVDSEGKKRENTEFISEGHVHNYALRKMIKLFLACLWLKWREGLNLPISQPYAISHLGHQSFIAPEDMTDIEAKPCKKSKSDKRASGKK